MNDASIGLGITHLVTGLILILVAIPLVRRRVKMNALYGVRIAKAFESESNWYAINEYGGRMLVRGGTVLATVGAAALVGRPGSAPAVLTVALAPLPVLLVTMLAIFRFARELPSATRPTRHS